MSVLFLGSSVLGILGFCALLLPLGYLLCYAADIAAFRSLPRSNQALWSTVIATPAAIVIMVLLERVLSVAAVGWCTVALALFGWGFALVRGSETSLSTESKRATRWGLVLAAALALYVMLAGLPIQVGDRLFDSLSTADLSVRVSLVDMATRHGVPVINPFYGIDGVHPPMRYYYYWYILCGVVARVFHLPARAALTASGAWAALLLLSSGFLLLSSLFRPRAQPCSMRLLCLLTVPTGMIIGLDILPMIGALLLHPPILYPEPDYWRSVSDFSPSFNLAMLYAPHHVAGAAVSFMLFLLILPPQLMLTLPAGWQERRSGYVWRGVLAGMCLAMLVGTSTYMAMFACIAGFFVLVDRLRHGDRSTAGVILGGAVLGLALSVPFLREVTHSQAHLQAGQQHQHMFHVSLHAWGMTKELVMANFYRTGHRPGRALEMLVRAVLWLALALIELGFLGVVLLVRARRDWVERHTLQQRQIFQWMLFFAIALPGFWLSSSSLAGANDLSRHAGVCLRFLGVLWAVPLVARYLLQREWRMQVNLGWTGRIALVLVAIGLVTQLYQIVAQRFYAMYSPHLTIARSGPFAQPADMAWYAHDVFHGFAALNDRSSVPRGNVLYDPMGDFWPTMNLYQTRYAVAGEKNCMTAFGGDIERCHQQMPAILQLFGGGQIDADVKAPGAPFYPASMTLTAMQTLCRSNDAAAVMVSRTDHAWNNPDSFVWHAPVLYASPRIRVLACTEAKAP